MGCLTPEQYLEIERKAEFKSEYYDGKIFARGQVNSRHDSITAELLLRVFEHLRGRPAKVHTANMRVALEPPGFFAYPDFSVTCEAPNYLDADEDNLTNPTLLVEILSPDAEGYELGKKASLYRKAPSVQELLFVAQDRYHAIVQRRQPDGIWSLRDVAGPNGVVELSTIDFTVRLGDLYAGFIPGRDVSLPC
jgi:Uma2 family endonuclease